MEIVQLKLTRKKYKKQKLILKKDEEESRKSKTEMKQILFVEIARKKRKNSHSKYFYLHAKTKNSFDEIILKKKIRIKNI